ncbi:MAG: sodium ion-translocating decarboxylase subunit beta [Magnetococcales bacterium]|nr:sodium ion-translocating decarboxylase subunit beta [Magnetococcales bacterium]
MDQVNVLDIFQGIATLVDSFQQNPKIAFMRIFLIGLGCLLIYLGRKGVLEPLLMVPMGLGMATVNAGVMFIPPTMHNLPEQGNHGTLFLNPMISSGAPFIDMLQIDFLQPIYSLTFSNGLIACLVFMGIGTLLDVGFIMARPFQSMFLALCGEIGTFLVLPIGVAAGLELDQAAAVSTIGGADGPMILFTSLVLAPELFVPITVVAYLYLGLTYGGYPYLIKLTVPERLRAIPMPLERASKVTPGQKLVFAVVSCIALSLCFPVAAPLFLSLFIGVSIRECGLMDYVETFRGPILYSSTFFLGLVLGILCEASTILDKNVLILLVLGILALTLAGLGGILGGYILYFVTGGKFNPVIGIAAVSCVPTTAKVAQKVVTAANPEAMILPHALGANISGVITSAIFAGVLISVVKAATGGG